MAVRASRRIDEERLEAGNAQAEAQEERAAPVAGSEAGQGAQSKPPVDRWEMVAVAAYYCGERRGFEPGGELDDWLHAEAEIYGLMVRPGEAGADSPAAAARAPGAPPL